MIQGTWNDEEDRVIDYVNRTPGGKPRNVPWPTVSVGIRPSWLRALKEIAAETGVTRTTVLRVCIERALNQRAEVVEMLKQVPK